MVRTSTAVLGVAGGVVAAVGAWSLYQRHATDTVPYTTVATLGDVELRRYPPAVVAATTASSEREAFRTLFRYISGANTGDEDVSMTTPVAVDGQGTSIRMTAPVETNSRTISMTAPVETTDDRDSIRMAFYLPEAYDIDSAPEPTEAGVELVSVPERTLAVSRFSWRPTEQRIAGETERLLDTLEQSAVPVRGEPFFMGYDAPWTLPFLRRNEVAVEVEPSA